MKRNTFYVTTPIYYVNAKPHIGSLYATLAADVLARWHRMKGADVFFLTGTDENSQKTLKAAEKEGVEPMKYLDDMAAAWKEIWSQFDISYDRFIRTTEADHHRGVQEFFKRLNPRDVYKAPYEGWYCVGCEEFYPEDRLVDGACPIHKTKPEWIREENYFFKASNYQEALVAYYEAHPEFIQPAARRNEMLGFLKQGLKDTSITRAGARWGIPFPQDESQRIYVWFEALLNYMTGIGYGVDAERFERFWPAQVQVLGKDIARFHALLWPAMLLSAGFALPEKLFVHGFITVNGEKMSKSLGNVIDPLELRAKYPSDVVRYTLFREFPFGQDGDFSYEKLDARYRQELANELGNLLHRVLSMTERYLDGVIPRLGSEDFRAVVSDTWNAYESAMDAVDFSRALEATRALVTFCNEYIEQHKPWVLAKDPASRERLSQVLAGLLESLRHIGWLVRPFMPRISDEIFTQLGLDVARADGMPFSEMKIWNCLPAGARVRKGQPLFPLPEKDA